MPCKSSRRAKDGQGPKKKGRRGWTTNDQEQFLSSQIPSYLASQASKARSDFWPPLWEKYFEQWPLPTPSGTDVANDVAGEGGGPEIASEGGADNDASKNRAKILAQAKQRIKEWFNNHTRESYRAGKNRAILNLTVKKVKLLPLHQAYSQLHYDTRIKEVVYTEWPAERARILEQKADGEDVKDPPETAPLWFRNKIIKSEFDAETNEVKREVEKYRQSLLNGSGGEPLDAGVDAEEAKRISTALARANAQSLVGETVARVLEQIKEQTGYVGFIALAGPDGQRSGDIKTLSLFSGKTALGHDFGHLYGSKKWQDYVISPLGKFAEKVYPPEARKAWALPSADPSTTIVDGGSNTRSTTVEAGPATDAQREAPVMQPDPRKEDLAPVDEEENSEDGLDGFDGENDADNDTSMLKKSLAATPKKRITDAYIDWDNGEPLTPAERKTIMALKSNYERARVMNVRRNNRLLSKLELKEDVKKLFQVGKGTGKKSTPAAAAPKNKTSSGGLSSTPTHTSKPDSAPATTTADTKVLANSGSPSRSKSTVPRLTNAISNGTHPYAERWPAWMALAVSKLEAFSDDPRWIGIVDLWLEFEELLGYPYGQTKAVLIDKSQRPEEVNSWLKYGRKYHAMPSVAGTVDKFGDAWMKWWAHLQPEWRSGSDGFLTDITDVPDDADWTELQKGGANGFFLILMSVCWWGAAVMDDNGKEIEPAYSKWQKAIEDVQWVLGNMVEGLETSNKHTHDEADEEDCVNDGSPSAKRRKIN